MQAVSAEGGQQPLCPQPRLSAQGDEKALLFADGGERRAPGLPSSPRSWPSSRLHSLGTGHGPSTQASDLVPSTLSLETLFS